jgi:hypothetical protein
MAETSYRARRIAAGEHAEGILDQTEEFRERAGAMAGDLRAAIEQHPYTTLAIAAGLAFTVGALWKLGQTRQPYSRLEAWRAQLPELPSREDLLPRRWR